MIVAHICGVMTQPFYSLSGCLLLFWPLTLTAPRLPLFSARLAPCPPSRCPLLVWKVPRTPSPARPIPSLRRTRGSWRSRSLAKPTVWARGLSHRWTGGSLLTRVLALWHTWKWRNNDEYNYTCFTGQKVVAFLREYRFLRPSKGIFSH